MRSSSPPSVHVPLAPRLLRRAAPVAAAAGLLGAFVLALLVPQVVQAQRGGDGIPDGHRPPPGLCRVWYDRVPAGRQPAPVDCASARAEAWRTGARVIVGEGGWRDDGWWDRGNRRDGPWWERGRRGERRNDGWWDGRRRDRDGRWEGRDRDDDDDDDDEERWDGRRRDRGDERWERAERQRREREARRRGGWWW